MAEWIQTRRRIDWMLGSLCLVVAIASVFVFYMTDRWQAFGSPVLVCIIWFWFRGTIPREGQPYSKMQIRSEHAFMIFTATVAFPFMLGIFLADWLDTPVDIWISAGVLVAFLVVMIAGGSYFERRLRGLRHSEKAAQEFLSSE